MGLKDYLNVLRRYMTVIVATTLIGGIAGAVFAFLLPLPPAPVFTANIQGVLLTAQAAEDLQNMVKLGGNFRATTKVLVLIPSPYGALTDQEYSKSRIAFYSDILETQSALDERVKVLSLENSTLAIVSVTDPDGALAEQL
jgi:capsular polysaccharide biosynthesis protein